MNPLDPRLTEGLRARCTSWLPGHGPMSARRWTEALAVSPHLDHALDVYSDGPAMQMLESQCASLLGKPASLFFHKGITGQQAALLALAGGGTVVVHPRSHLVENESNALTALSGLDLRHIGPNDRPFTAADLAKSGERPAVVTVELPLRQAGFLAPSWDELTAIAAWCRDNGAILHLDGARIWELQPYYGRPLAEIAALAESIYVSFYKGLGGMGGCVVAGPQALVDAMRPWRNRFGGDLYTAFPFVVTALDGLARHLPAMPAYFAHATALAAALADVPGIRVLPAAPHGNSFRVEFAAPPAAIEMAALAHAEAHGEWLFSRIIPTAWPDRSAAEIVIGAASVAWPAAAQAAAIAAVLAASAEKG
jgi:threonine aldolase